ncbi:MAG: hypothetical protein C0392_10115 [Syntrophus sp. (in: bacteria)]|nr:hypothetical protein [Syntrophus sp. (in: bacteria)]
MGILRNLRGMGGRRSFSAWQIEVTTRCSLCCTMCIKEEYKNWYRRDMEMEDFRKIIPYLNRVKSVVLEGWGESLLHKDLIEFIRLAKKEGPEVGFVTSGTGLDEQYAARLVDAGVDFIGFSLSGARAETHNSIRVNSDFNVLLDSMRHLIRLRKERQSEKPRVHIVYLMVRDNIIEVPQLIDIARDAGVGEVVLVNLVLVSNKRQDKERVFTCKEGEEPYGTIIEEAKAKARRMNIKLVIPSLSPRNVSVCSENPLLNLYISVDGEVSPCVYLYPPIPSPVRRIFCGDEYLQEKVSFGNIFREHFDTIWNKEEYRRFRERFIARQKKMRELYESFIAVRMAGETVLPESPEPCRTCHKIKGL